LPVVVGAPGTLRRRLMRSAETPNIAQKPAVGTVVSGGVLTAAAGDQLLA
jgi:hypothetical protein